jgi:anaerobic sulfite reductase subunit B
MDMPVPSDVPAADALVPRRYRVADRRVETHDTVTLELAPMDTPLPPADPGQFHMLWAFGIGEVPISVSRLAVEAGGPVAHTIRAVGRVTEALCRADPGDVVGVRGPFGTDWGVDQGNANGGDAVVIAGGIGLAPLRPVIDTLLGRPVRSRRVHVLVGARSPSDLEFTSELERWREGEDTEIEVTVDSADPGWPGNVGVVTKLLARVDLDPVQTVAFICGPEVMIRFAARALLDRGVGPARIRVSMERNMQCAVRRCGHCQLGPTFVCADGPVFSYEQAAGLMEVREL